MNLSQVWLLYRSISQNQRLQARRHPMFEKNLVMKILGYIFIAFWAVYLIVIGGGCITARAVDISKLIYGLIL